MAAVTSGLVAPARDCGGHEAIQEFIARPAVIQHVGTVNIYMTSANADARDPQKLPAGYPSPPLRQPGKGSQRVRRRQPYGETL